MPFLSSPADYPKVSLLTYGDKAGMDVLTRDATPCGDAAALLPRLYPTVNEGEEIEWAATVGMVYVDAVRTLYTFGAKTHGWAGSGGNSTGNKD